MVIFTLLCFYYENFLFRPECMGCCVLFIFRCRLVYQAEVRRESYQVTRSVRKP